MEFLKRGLAKQALFISAWVWGTATIANMENQSILKEGLKYEKETDLKRHRPVVQKDIALTCLLVFLLMYIFFLYPLGQVGSFRPLTSAFFSLILISGGCGVGTPRFQNTGFLMGFSHLRLSVDQALFPHQTFVFAADGLALFFLVLLTFLF